MAWFCRAYPHLSNIRIFPSVLLLTLEIQNLPGGRQVRNWILLYFFKLHISFKKWFFIFWLTRIYCFVFFWHNKRKINYFFIWKNYLLWWRFNLYILASAGWRTLTAATNAINGSLWKNSQGDILRKILQKQIEIPELSFFCGHIFNIYSFFVPLQGIHYK